MKQCPSGAVKLRSAEVERRAFLASCGRFATVTGPAVTALLSVTLTSEAIAKSGGSVSNGNNGWGNGGGDGTPGGSGKGKYDKLR